MPERISYSVKEAAELTGLSEDAIYEACRRGEFPHVKVGRRVLIPKKRFELWFNGGLPDGPTQALQSPLRH